MSVGAAADETRTSPAAALAPRAAAAMFAAFAFAYFLSALVRGVVATLAPHVGSELGLGAAELGLLAGAYFLGFAAMQLPMGSALDRFGPKRVLLVLMAVAVVGSIAFARAPGFAALAAARALIGVGVSACLMAPMTAFRRRFSGGAQVRGNAWMLMIGSLGMVASTLPVQWLLPLTGWRGLFVVVAAAMAAAFAAIAWLVPADAPLRAPAQGGAGYGAVFRHPSFVAFAPLGFFVYGGMVAVQTLWAGPWMVQVGGATPLQSAQGLFGINLAMLVSFFAWGSAGPWLAARGWSAERLIAWGMPLGLGVLVAAIAGGRDAGALAWGAFCVASTVVTLSLPAVGMSFGAALAGRALSAFNLVVFVGVFVLQWGIGIGVDAGRAAGWTSERAFQAAFAVFASCGLLAYAWFVATLRRGSRR